MRENSGQGDASTNTQDPTLKDNEGTGGTAPRPGQDFTEGAPLDIGDDTQGSPSPSDRARGETAKEDPASPVDID